MFKAVLIEKTDAGQSASVKELDEASLPEGNVTVRVAYSTLNYKDALAITGKGPIVKSYPMVPGIDFVGTVEQSDDPAMKVGTKVILNGWGVGERHWGGLAELARVKSEWLIPLNPMFTMKSAIGVGTAGYTAMLCVMALEKHGVRPGDGEVLVTGASGGVGGIAVAILGKLGYHVVALTGRPQEADYLMQLGASDILDRAELSGQGKPLVKERWAGVIDVVGGQVLANILAGVRYGGTVAACGLAGGAELNTTVMPFILRGVTLTGVDSVMCPRKERMIAWSRLAQDLDQSKLESVAAEISLDDVIATSEQLIAGQVRGRVIVPLAGE